MDRLTVERSLREASATGNVELLTEILPRYASEVWAVLKDDRDGSENRLTPLHKAVIGGYNQVVEILLTCAPNHDPASFNGSFNSFDFLHARTCKGHTAVHLAVVSGNEAILGFLIRKYDGIHKRPNSEWDFADHLWMTPLHYAVLGNLTAQTNQLLAWAEYNRHVNARDFFQRTPLHLASCHRPVRVEALVRHPTVDINSKDCLSLTPLHWAVYFGRTDVVRCLVKAVSELDTAEKKTLQAIDRDVEGRSVLEIAMEDSLLNLIPEVSNIHPRVPFQDDQFFLAHETPTLHCEVNFEIEKLLRTCPDVAKEAEALERNLTMYMNAINAILLVAALVAGASISMYNQSDFSDKNASAFLYISFVSMLLSFYLSVATVLAGATIIRPPGNVVPVARRVSNARRALYGISWLLGLSVMFFILAFYAENAIYVTKGEPAAHIKIPYHIISGIAMTVCIIVILWFLRLHLHVKTVLDDTFNDMEALVTIPAGETGFFQLWISIVEVYIVHMHFSGVFDLLIAAIQRRLGTRNMSGRYQRSSVVSRATSRRLLLQRAKQLYDGYFISKCVAMEVNEIGDIQEEGEIEMIERRTEAIKKQKCSSFQIRMAETLYAWDGEDSSGLVVLLYLFGTLSAFGAAIGAAMNLGWTDPALKLRNRYWQRHKVLQYGAERFISTLQKQILELEKVYTDLSLSMKQEDRSSGRYKFVIDRHYMGFLDRLPSGLFFWIECWKGRRTKDIAIFYRGYVFERDLKIWSDFSQHISATRER